MASFAFCGDAAGGHEQGGRVGTLLSLDGGSLSSSRIARSMAQAMDGAGSASGPV
jgi:hypothetical protein